MTDSGLFGYKVDSLFCLNAQRSIRTQVTRYNMHIEEELLSKLRSYQQTQRRIGSLKTQLVLPADADEKCDVLVVLMHGYGAPPDDLVGLAASVLIDCFRGGCRPMLAFPGAPLSLEYGGAAWWHLNMERLMEATAKNSFDEMREEVPPGIDAAREAVCECVTSISNEYGFNSSKLVLGGFSQGAMIAMDVATRGLECPPAGLGMLSGACICEALWRQAAGDRLKSTAAFQSHGRQDPILPFQTGKFLNDVLSDVCDSVDFYPFDGGHQIPERAISGLAGLVSNVAAT
jgi:phospholipase/carboxylesterase